MPIPYEVRPSKLQVGSFSAVIRTGPIFDNNALAEEMASRSGYNTADCLAQINLLEQVARDHLALGENVQVGNLVLLGCSLKGKLPTAESEAVISSLSVAAKAHRELTEWLRTNAALEKRDASYTGPFISSNFNVTQDAPNVAATGDLLRIVGSNLKFASGAADEGVYFVPTGVGAAVKATVFATATEGRIELVVPTIGAANHWLEVRARRRNSVTLQTYRFPTALTPS